MCDDITNKVLSLKDGEKVSMSEIFSFSWDKAYCYGGYITEEQFDEFFNDAPCKPNYIDNCSEAIYRLVFYKDDKIVFNTFVGNDWIIWPENGNEFQIVLSRDSILEVNIWTSFGVSGVTLYYD